MGFAYQGLLDDLRAIAFSLKKCTLVVIHGFESNSDLFLGRKKIQNKPTTTTKKIRKVFPGRQCKGLSVVTHDLIPCPVERTQSC